MGNQQMANVINMRGAREVPKAERSRMQTEIVTPETFAKWTIPPFQRPLRVNAKVRGIAEELKTNGGIISGILTLGMLGSDKRHFVIDGQHRIEAAKISGLPEFIADVREVPFDSMAEMAQEFVRLNSVIVRLQSDDVLRGLETSIQGLRIIRKVCPFVGYGQIRRSSSASSPTLSMSLALRSWFASAGDTPSAAGGLGSTADIAAKLAVEDAEAIARFLSVARQAWGHDLEYSRLWGGLNLSLCMWLWRHLVLNRERGVKRFVVLNQDQFKKCLMSLSASRDYLDWLVGRIMSERDRAPCYQRIKAAFVMRLKQEKIAKPMLPQPAWATK